MYVTFIFTFYY